jgi:UDP-glucose 4-epimerase
MDKRILVTGGAGFIGSHIARRLLSEGHRVLIIDNLSSGYEKNIPAAADFLNMDISDYKALMNLPAEGIKAVVHLAAQSSGEISHEKPLLDVMTNSVGTMLLLRWCKDNGVKRFIFSSSMAAYGHPQTLCVKETDACHPLSLYGISKLAGENYVNHFGREGINTTIFRLFSIYGPGQDLNNMKQGMVSIYLSYLLKNQALHVKGSGDRFRDFTYIDDVTDVIARSIDSSVTFGNIYNLATGIKTLVKDLVRVELAALGKNIQSYPVKYEGSTPDDQFGLYADISKIKNDLNWKPRFMLSEGIRRMVEWAKS